MGAIMTPSNTQERRGFHLNKDISIEAIIAFISLLIAGIGYVFLQDRRSTRLEDAVQVLHESDKRADKERLELKTDIISRLDRIEARLYEQNGKH
jgi:hypothetical protein